MSSLEQRLLELIGEEAQKLAQRYHQYHNRLYVEHARNRRRVRPCPDLELKIPDYWSVDPRFNPFHVLKKRQQIARSIATKIQKGAYAPYAPHLKTIPKRNGGHRVLSIYQIPDAAVSTLYYRALLAKNRHRFSSFSYAYRSDRNVQFAIQDVAYEITTQSRIFIAEFDFSDFFGTIGHAYLYRQLKENAFSVSGEDEMVIRAFLHGREQGIPQGTSLSLFLANMVCWKLDRSFEEHGLRFARYADDTVVWSRDYSRITKAFDLIHDFSRDSGVPINVDKSAGISLLARKGLRSEFGSERSAFDFLGYSISPDRVGIRAASVARLKKRISYILYRNLIQPLRSTTLRAQRIPSNGRDYHLVVALGQVRRYLYGNLSEALLRAHAAGYGSRLAFKGLMSYYPLVTDEEQLRALDGWLVSVLFRALRLRAALLLRIGYDRRTDFPFNVPRNRIVSEMGRARHRRLLAVPSFLRVFRAMQIRLRAGGLHSIVNPAANRYAYIGP